MLGIEVAKSTVERYKPRTRRPSSPSWRVFLDQHAHELVSMDFFVVPTASLKVLFVLVVLAILAVVFSVIGAFYYLRVVKLMYFDEAENEALIEVPADFGAAISLNGILILGLGVFSSSLIAICMASFRF